MFEEWEDFGIHVGPFGLGVGRKGRSVHYVRTDTSHVLRIRLDSAVKKEVIKVRLVKPGLLEVEWPRATGEEIPVE
jgi:HSP20 family molecular chaperone IbpA